MCYWSLVECGVLVESGGWRLGGVGVCGRGVCVEWVRVVVQEWRMVMRESERVCESGSLAVGG